mgnify:CR=1 FL=1
MSGNRTAFTSAFAMVFFSLAFLCVSASSLSAASNEDASALFAKAVKFDKASEYSKAYEAYSAARDEFLKKNDAASADRCRIRMLELQRIAVEYPYSRDDVLKALAEGFPGVDESERKSWVDDGRIESVTMDGTPFYIVHAVANLTFRNPDLLKNNPKAVASSKDFHSRYDGLITARPQTGYTPQPWKPYVNPRSYFVSTGFVLPREELPKSGRLQVWFPIAIQTAAQDNVRVISAKPEQYVKGAVRTDGDIGAVYMEVPLDHLNDKAPLELKVQFLFTHYQQRFIIDPAQVGEYDTTSEFFQKYTKSYKNTTISPSMKEKAMEITGGEKNPYLAAKKIYHYVVENIQYSLMPHLSLSVLGEPESLYVEKRRFGDCGAQSVYFSALCRALGIPARTTGGFQLCPGHISPHFWAEFFLPNYGWVPVDTSIAQIAGQVPGISAEARKTFEDYFFGNQDPFRLVIQRDVDVPLTPEPPEPILLPMAVQKPAVVCTTSQDNLALKWDRYLKQEIQPVDE